MALAEHLIGKGLSLLIYDAEVHLSNLLGANRRFIERHIPHIGSLIRRDLAEVVENSDLLVVGSSDPDISASLVELARPDQIVVDLVNLPSKKALRSAYEGLCWKQG